MTRFEKNLLIVLMTALLWAVENFSRGNGKQVEEYRQLIAALTKDILK